MSKRTIWYFIKFFSEERYADQFIKGNLYLNRLSFFKKVEDHDEDGRPDANEAVAMWWQPHDIRINLDVPGIGSIEITKDDLAGPVSTSFDYHNHFHILCLYAVQVNGFDTADGKLDLSEDDVGEFRRQILIDEQCLKFGPFAVVIYAVPFMEQLKRALEKRGQKCRARLVEYYDEEIFHGSIPIEDIPFKKQKKFSYQKEFRICVQTGTKGDDPISIDIGDMSQFCGKVESSRLNSVFEIKLEPAPPASEATAVPAQPAAQTTD